MREYSAHSLRRFTKCPAEQGKNVGIVCFVTRYGAAARASVGWDREALATANFEWRSTDWNAMLHIFAAGPALLSVPGVHEQNEFTFSPNVEPLRERLMQRGSSESVSLVFCVPTLLASWGYRRLSRSDLHELLHILSSFPPPKIAWI